MAHKPEKSMEVVMAAVNKALAPVQYTVRRRAFEDSECSTVSTMWLPNLSDEGIWTLYAGGRIVFTSTPTTIAAYLNGVLEGHYATLRRWPKDA
jgi:hypothetical protein